MTRGEFEMFLLWGVGLCVGMALVSLVRFRTRGKAAIALAGAFAAMAAVLWLLRSEADRPLIIAGFVVVFLCLVADFALRSAGSGGRPSE